MKALSPPNASVAYALPRNYLNNLPLLSRHRNNGGKHHRVCDESRFRFDTANQMLHLSPDGISASEAVVGAASERGNFARE
jgi:hypothetical protein